MAADLPDGGDSELQPGMRAEVVGLQSAQQHNGFQGILLSSTESDQAADAFAKGRKAMRLDSGQLLALKPANLQPVSYVMAAIAGKGMGVISTRNIKRGERIIAEPPLLVITKGSEMLTVAAVNDLPPGKRALFDGLHNAKTMPFKDHPYEDILGTFSTNNICIDRDGCLSGTFVTISRFNHSCSPNVEWDWNEKLQAETVHACRDILRGEELCPSYMNIEANPGLCSPSSVRSATLKLRYGFLCCCSVCTLPGGLKADSDMRRGNIFLLGDRIITAIQEGRNGDGERLVKERLQLLSEERLEEASNKRVCSADAYQACKHAGWHERAREWLEAAAAYALVSVGADSAVYHRYKCMLQLPLDAPFVPSPYTGPC